MPETERRPYFLYGALAVPGAWVAYFAFAFLIGLLFARPSSADMGNWGRAMVIMFFLIIASIVIGLICSAISVIRRERFRGLGFACLAVYALPILLYGFLAILSVGAKSGQEAMNEMHTNATSKSPPGTLKNSVNFVNLVIP